MPTTDVSSAAPTGPIDLNASRLWSSRDATRSSAPASTTSLSAAADAASAAATTTASVETSVSTTAGEATVDSDRVTQIRHAIEHGTYPILPARISDAMIAAGIILQTGSHANQR